jgi:mRNA interferase RelE/StbE
MYRIFETETFIRSLKQDFGDHRKKIIKKLKEYVYPQLKISPELGNNIKKLRDWEPPTWRYRIANYRFFYELDKDQKFVFMTVAAHRSKSYK